MATLNYLLSGATPTLVTSSPTAGSWITTGYDCYGFVEYMNGASVVASSNFDFAYSEEGYTLSPVISTTVDGVVDRIRLRNYKSGDVLLGQATMMLPSAKILSGTQKFKSWYEHYYDEDADVDYTGLLWGGYDGETIDWNFQLNEEVFTGYTLTYNANGGSGVSPTSRTGVTTFTLPDTQPSRSGYILLGWATTSNATTPNLTNGQTIAANTTAYAVWKQVYTVTYSGNGNEFGAPPSTQIGSETYTVQDNTSMYKSGYDFAGWNTSADGTGTSFNVGASITPSANVTLYAKWIASNIAYVPSGTMTAAQLESYINVSGYERVELTGDITISSGNPEILQTALIDGNGYRISTTNTIYLGNGVDMLNIKLGSTSNAFNQYVITKDLYVITSQVFNNVTFDSRYSNGDETEYTAQPTKLSNIPVGLRFNNCTFNHIPYFISDDIEIDGCTFARSATFDMSDSSITNCAFTFAKQNGGIEWTTMRFWPRRRYKSISNNTISNITFTNQRVEEVISVDHDPIGLVGEVTDIDGDTIIVSRLPYWTLDSSLAAGCHCMFADGVNAGQYNEVTAISNVGDIYTIEIDTSRWDLSSVQVGDHVKVGKYFADNSLTDIDITMIGGGGGSTGIEYCTGISLYGSSCGNKMERCTVTAANDLLSSGFNDHSLGIARKGDRLAYAFNSRNQWIDCESINCNVGLSASLKIYGNPFHDIAVEFAMLQTPEAFISTIHELFPLADTSWVQYPKSCTIRNFTSNGCRVQVCWQDDIYYTGDEPIDAVIQYTPDQNVPAADHIYENYWHSGAEEASGGPLIIACYNATLLLDWTKYNPYYTRGFTGNLTTEPDITFWLAYPFNTPVDNNIALYRGTIAYDANGGTGDVPTTQDYKQTYLVKFGDTISSGSNIFSHWNTAADGSGTSYYPMDELTPSSDITLYAQYVGVGLPIYVNSKQVLEMYVGGKRVTGMYVGGKSVF